MKNDPYQMQKVWDTEQEILDVVHEVCTKYGLRYSLAYGTLIGAIRHQGFIPWDDDIDLAMPREDYETLLKIWSEAAPEGYLLQNTRTDEDFTQNFTKIRKNHTTFLQDDRERTKRYQKGVFVDIFPFDRVAASKSAYLVQYAASAVNLLYSRGFTSGHSGVIGRGEQLLLHVPRNMWGKIRKESERIIGRWNGQKSGLYFSPNTIENAKKFYPADLFDAMTTVVFGGKEYMCVSDWDTFLRIDYGDYMQLPPEEERVWTHHPILVDFAHNYEELISVTSKAN